MCFTCASFAFVVSISSQLSQALTRHTGQDARGDNTRPERRIRHAARTVTAGTRVHCGHLGNGNFCHQYASAGRLLVYRRRCCSVLPVRSVSRRDAADEVRPGAPLKSAREAEDVIIVDTTNLEFDEVLDRLEEYVKTARNGSN